MALLNGILLFLSFWSIIQARWLVARHGPWMAWLIINGSVVGEAFTDPGRSFMVTVDGMLTPLATAWVVAWPEHWRWVSEDRLRGLAIMLACTATYVCLGIVVKVLYPTHPQIAVSIDVIVVTACRAIWYAFLVGDDDRGSGIRRWVRTKVEGLRWSPEAIGASGRA